MNSDVVSVYLESTKLVGVVTRVDVLDSLTR
jgi:predicted transcriptional regulator